MKLLDIKRDADDGRIMLLMKTKCKVTTVITNIRVDSAGKMFILGHDTTREGNKWNIYFFKAKNKTELLTNNNNKTNNINNQNQNNNNNNNFEHDEIEWLFSDFK